jgi:hypothetical protein
MALFQRQLDLFRVQVLPCGRSSAAYCELEKLSLLCLRCGCFVPALNATPNSSW